MPRTTRASASATPTPALGELDASSMASSPSAPRKAPRCTKCKQLRAGHPRSGCPNVDSLETPTPSPSAPLPQKGDTKARSSGPAKGRRSLGDPYAGGNLLNAMSSMNISDAEESTKQTMRDRTRTRRRQSEPLRSLEGSHSLLSLSTTSGEIVERLVEEGVLDEDTEPEDNTGPAFTVSPLETRPSKIIKWQGTMRVETTLNPERKAGLRRPKASPASPMPGTLYTPNSSFFESNSTIQGSFKQEPEENTPRIMDDAVTRSHIAPSPSHTPKPLGRTMSMEQRDFFLSRVGHTSRAALHVLPKDILEEIVSGARGMGYVAEVVMNDDDDDSQALLVVGKDAFEVEKLWNRVSLAGSREESLGPSTTSTESKPSRLGAVAGGAVVGAVGAWAGLAFT